MKLYYEIHPPGINATYKVTGSRMYKSDIAVDWQTSAALAIGSKAGEIDWKDSHDYYGINIYTANKNMDVDATVKLVIDTIAQKLDFNDKRITEIHVYKELDKDYEGIFLELFGI